jgi:glycosyltransferase involved in cell wall biosynthesis
VEGVVWFCREVLPLVQESIPDVTLTICGARPNTKVRALARLPGVNVTGRVPDVRPYLAEACCCVVPLRIARGVQNKLLEAMAMGLPAVCCEAVYRGIQAEKDEQVFVADEPADFAEKVVQLLQDEDLRDRVGNNARACVETTYAWDVQLARLDKLLADVVSGRPVRVN